MARRRFLIGLIALHQALAGAQPVKPGIRPVRVGLLTSRSSESQLSTRMFVGAMRALGWMGGRNVAYDVVFAEGDEARLPALAAQLVARKPDLVVVQTHPEARAVLDQTRTIPIVFGGANDPYPKLVKSLARPGGNVTGISNIGWELAGKRMQLLKETLPKLNRVGVLVSAIRSTSERELRLIEKAATAGVKVIPATITDAGDLTTALSQLVASRVEAVLPTHVAIFRRERAEILHVAAKHRLPVFGFRSDFAEEGALMAYGADFSEQMRRCAHLADKVLKGTPAGDIPVEQPIKFELIVNMKTAKALGISVPQSILLQATRVIE